jgi:hypothetical protein
MPIPIRFFPFRRELDDLFRTDRSIWWKIVGSAFATTFVVFFSAQTAISNGPLKNELSLSLVAAIAGTTSAIGAFLALALSLKDVVERRVKRGDSVNPLLKLYLGLGFWSLVVWFPTALFAAIFITIAAAIWSTNAK